MSVTLIVHIANEDPVVMEVEDLPAPGDLWIKGINPRRRDNKEVSYLLPEVTTVIYPTWRINFIEVMPGGTDEEIITTVRSDKDRRDY